MKDAIFHSADKLFVASNKNPDLDGYACAVGYAEFLNHTGKESQAILLGEIDDETKYILNMGRLQPLARYQGKINSDLVIVDMTRLENLGENIDEKLLVEIIDHRRVNDAHRYPWARIQNELVGSCATLITEKFIKEGVKPSITSAYLLYGAIISNTINFKNRITTDRDHKAAEFLKQFITLPENFAHDMFKARTNIEGGNLSRYLHKDFIQLVLSNKEFTVFQMEIVETDKVITERLQEIEQIMADIVAGKNLNFFFLNMIDTIKAFNYIIAINDPSKELLENVLNMKFDGNYIKTDYIIMRKELMALIRDYFDKQIH